MSEGIERRTGEIDADRKAGVTYTHLLPARMSKLTWVLLTRKGVVFGPGLPWNELFVYAYLPDGWRIETQSRQQGCIRDDEGRVQASYSLSFGCRSIGNPEEELLDAVLAAGRVALELKYEYIADEAAAPGLLYGLRMHVLDGSRTRFTSQVYPYTPGNTEEFSRAERQAKQDAEQWISSRFGELTWAT